MSWPSCGTLASDSPGRVSFFAATVPGLGPLLRDEVAAHPDLDPNDEAGFDGRADLVFFRVRRGARLQLDGLRLAEDLFVVISGARSGPADRVAASLTPLAGLERALSVRAAYVRHLSPSMTFRVITRVMDESRFRRTELRSAIERAIGTGRPRWRIADPADLEVWAVEHRRAQFVSGLRLSDQRLRRHGEGRVSERHGALRPVAAAAMVRLAGAGPGRLLDPCCGSGTIVREALAAGWDAQGSDLDQEAVDVARANVAGAAIRRADALSLPHPDGAFDAVVTNLPFGRQFRPGAERLRGGPAGPSHVARSPATSSHAARSSAASSHAAWVRGALREAARVTRPGGRVVVLVPAPVPGRTDGLTLSASYPVELLGVPARIWIFDREARP
jgi:tRNA G10  N-methylase Trm11